MNENTFAVNKVRAVTWLHLASWKSLIFFLLFRHPKKLPNSDHHSKRLSKKKREGNLESEVSSTADPFTTHEITEKAKPEGDAKTSSTTEFTTTEKQWKVYELYQHIFIIFTNYTLMFGTLKVAYKRLWNFILTEVKFSM